MANNNDRASREAEERNAKRLRDMTTEGRFQGLAEEADRWRDTPEDLEKKRKEERYAETAARALVEDAKEAARIEGERIEMENRAQFGRMTESAKKQAKQASLKAAGKKGAMKGGVSMFARVVGVGGAWTMYSLQFFFAIISLVFIAANGAVLSISENIIVKGVIKAVTKVISLFADIGGFAPLEDLALAFWALSALIAVFSFFTFLLVFTFTAKGEAFDTPLMHLATSLTFAGSILPISNLAPWIPIWVMLITARTTYKYAQSAKNLFSG